MEDSPLEALEPDRDKRIIASAWFAAFTLVTIAVAAIIAYFAALSVTGTTVTLGPVKIGFEARPALRGHSVVELPPVGTLESRTHSTPVRVTYTLKEIAVERAEELTREDSLAREELRDWRGPVGQAARALLLRAVAVATITAAAIAWLIRRRWRWAVIGAVTGCTLALTFAWVTWASYDIDAFSEPEYTGSLSHAPEIVGFSQEVLAKLDTLGDQVPRIAADLFNTINEIRQLPLEFAQENTLRVLHVSDLHASEAGAELLQNVATQYKAGLVIDTGDITELGLPFELEYPGSFLPLEVPYVWIGGNHDNGVVTAAMKEIDGVTVIENEIVEIGGLRIAGFPDPSAADVLPTVATDRELEASRALIEGILAAEPPPPDIVAVHDPGQAEDLPGEVPVILNGHTHDNGIRIVAGTTWIDAGSTGAGGLRGVEPDGETPASLQVLYFDPVTLRLLAVDTIVIYGFSQEFRVSRQVIEAE